ncbi:DUF599 domain-containing protein [Mesobaculum littorinae]|uniref:DUF599 domain-containing protein n=1 Tax=Mesobaculum littorinae TaxID=2486419 RepID=A0A438AE19_9RHOB|nr:DUF599 domain-containing protein [Mesobaculum littorinae]RVV96892.1 DUF599 domain-containing protein [Mesobaculum littorinae]
MMLLDRFLLLTPLDFAALALLLVASRGIGWWIENPGLARPSVTVLMADYRRAWLREFVTRQPRIFDATILSTLRQGTTFFASTCVIAIGGVMALLGNSEALGVIAEDFTEANVPMVVWEIKLLLVALFLTDGFLKFVWSNRLFGYCAVVMAAVPNDTDDPVAYARAAQAGEINVRAAWNFNRGLRAMYFSLGSAAWLLGPWALIAATCFTCWILWSREFRSRPREILLSAPSPIAEGPQVARK